MAVLTINDNPSVTDTIVFTIQTPDLNGCLLSNPYVVNKLTIYFVERNFASENANQYDDLVYDSKKTQAADEAEALACSNPTEENIKNAQKLRTEANSSASVSSFYFNEAVPVQIVGDDIYPAWLSTDTSNAFIEQDTDSLGSPIPCQFTYTWQPEGMREGDYFLCWSWNSLPAGSSLSSHLTFHLNGDTQVTTSIPTHYTNPDKYPTLLDRYLPEMFKLIISNDDRTPDVLNKLNGAIASGFNVLEDLTNQIVDLQDANSIHESMINYLSNLFDLKLKTHDPTRWRGQIKRAIPLFKMKGTKSSVYESMEHAGIRVLGIHQLWQVISSHTWQESFVFDGTNTQFELEKVALPVDYDNFELWLRPPDSDWVSLSLDYIDFNTDQGLTTVTWVGDTLSIDPIDLVEGDEIRILYKYYEINSPTDQSIENYIRSLPLMDQRDERNQIYPLKNWNVRVISNNDPMFDIIVNTRNPYNDFLVYGKIRTEFPYSENIYNMEEYNGSIRNSKVPCDIDKDFIDPCTACISSSYNIDLEIEDLSNDRIIEAQEILTETMPFHAVLHTLNFLGGINEFVESPVENVSMLVSVNGTESVISGEGQMWFNRLMKLVETQGITRNQLADITTPIATISVKMFNDEIVVFCPNKKLDNVGISLEGNAKITILAPSPLAGTYNISNPDGNVVKISLPILDEPINNCNNIFANDDTINSCAFTFDINNLVLDGSLCNISQDNIFEFYDSSQNFGTLPIQSTFDVEQGTATHAWKLLIPSFSATPYVIQNVLPDGKLNLTNNGGLSGNSSGISWSLLDGSNSLIKTGALGNLETTNRGRVTVLNSSFIPIQNIISLKNFYFVKGSFEYPIIEFYSNNQFYIGNYTDGDSNGVDLTVKQKVVSGEIGYFTHRGIKLQALGNLESSLGIQNGDNSYTIDGGIENNGFKENFIIQIGSDYYFISEISGTEVGPHEDNYTTITLSGPDHYWKTYLAGGTYVDATFYQFLKNGATIMGQQYDLPEHTFRTLDRAGRSVIDYVDQDQTVTQLSSPDEINELVNQKENINIKIEYSDGTVEEGDL